MLEQNNKQSKNQIDFFRNFHFIFFNRGKKKLAQVAKETKEQLNNLQSKLELANTGILNIKNRIYLFFIFRNDQ